MINSVPLIFFFYQGVLEASRTVPLDQTKSLSFWKQN